MLPDFERACLSEIYESRAHKNLHPPVSVDDAAPTHVKVKFIRTDLEEVIDPSRMVWCPAPYELPCQSLFFALLKYRQVLSEVKWAGSQAKLESFKFVHLANIKR